MVNSEVPDVKKIARAYTVPQLMLLVLLALFFWKAFLPANLSMAAAYGAVVCLLYSFGSKSLEYVTSK